MPNYVPVTVSVPEELVPELLDFATGLASRAQQTHERGATDAHSSHAPSENVPLEEASKQQIQEYWGLLSARARELIGFLAARPGVAYSGEDIAEHCDVDGKYGVAGALKWPLTYANRMGLTPPISWDSESNRYHVSPEVAAVLPTA